MYAAEFFEQKVWQPLGAEFPASFSLDRLKGLENSPSSFQCTALDLALLKEGIKELTSTIGGYQPKNLKEIIQQKVWEVNDFM